MILVSDEILNNKGDFELALKYVGKAKTLEGKYHFYKRKFEKEEIEKFVTAWKSKVKK